VMDWKRCSEPQLLPSKDLTLLNIQLCDYVTQLLLSEISGSHTDEYEDDSLLGYSFM
jgi:hypothetical protein